MKLLVIFFISCMAGVYSRPTQEEEKELAREIQIVKQCAQELKVDEKKYLKSFNIEEYVKNPEKEATCMLACINRKDGSDTNADLIGSTNKDTLYNYLKDTIDKTYKKANPSFAQAYPIENVVNKVDNCYASEATECDFYSCIEKYESPYVEVYLQNILNSFNGK